MNNKNTRLYEIDLLRFLAAMAVVFFHYTFRGYAEGAYSPIEFPVMGEFSRYGYLGVHLFFMISGFVILLSAMNRTAISFASSRFIRLYPAFWAGVTVSAIIIYLFGMPHFSVGMSQYLMNLTMVSGFVGIEHVDGVYWTLLVELKFYALIFLLLLINKIKQIEYFLAAWLVVVFINIVVPLPKIISFFLFPEWAALFISGSLFYIIYINGFNIYRGIMLFCAYLLALYYGVQEVKEVSTFYSSSFSNTVVLFWLSIFYLIFVLIILNKMSWIRSDKLVKIGLLTYPLYLIHQNIGFIVFNTFGASINKYVLLIALINVMLVISWLINILVERPLGGFLHNKNKQLQHKFLKASS